MLGLAKALTVLAALTFAVGVVTNFFLGTFLNTPAEGYSRACSNLALLAIAVWMVFGPGSARSAPLS